MSRFGHRGRTLTVLGSIALLLALLAWVALRTGPMAPIAVTTTTVESRALNPALSGIGLVEAQHIAKLGPTAPGRLLTLRVDVGDRVEAGTVLAEMDPTDLAERRRALSAAVQRANAAVAEAVARRDNAAVQHRRYSNLAARQLVSDEALASREQERTVTDAALAVARAERERLQAELEALDAGRATLVLRAPADGLVVARHADVGDTLVAGETVLEVLEPASLWVDVRFDQVNSQGLAVGLPALIRLRSDETTALPGVVRRLEPKADAVTEERVAKITFATLPEPLPPLGELVDVTLALPQVVPRAVIPNAAIRRDGGRVGVWRIEDGSLQFAPIRTGATDLDGHVQVLEGLAVGDRVVVHSERALTAGSRITIVERIPGTPR